MGDLIFFSARGGDEPASVGPRDGALDSHIHFYFALDCLLSYRIAERIERALGEVSWVPVLGHFPADSRRAARAATLAAERGACRRFALAIQRLLFCGGFALSRASTIRQAAAAAGLDPDELTAAASDPAFDLGLDAATKTLRAKGIDSPPAISIGDNWFEGPDAVVAALSFRAAQMRL